MQETTPRSAAVPLIDDAILRSPMVAHGNGFGMYAGLPDPYTFNALFNEAAELYPSATIQQSWEADLEECRGGRPRRSLLTSTGGAIQDAWYASDHLRRFLSSQIGLPVVPAGNRGSYSYYARNGDFLDLHRDVEACDVTVITVLHDNSPPTDPGGALTLYPGLIREALSTIRQHPEHDAQLVKILPGQTLFLFGGVVPHRVVPVGEGQLRIISALCFKALTGDEPVVGPASAATES
jgi:hypothetical protein